MIIDFNNFNIIGEKFAALMGDNPNHKPRTPPQL